MPQETLFESTPSNNKSAISLSGLTTMVSNALTRNPSLRNVWVIAELTDVRISGGHGYMELIEKDSAGATTAKLRATIWRSRLPELRRNFFAATGRDIATGLKVMVKGDVNHHQLYGLSFNINDIDPSYTLGDLERIKREIIRTLANEGVLELQHRLPIPVAPRCIAVISAAGAAGYGDFINQLKNNAYGYVFYPFLFGAVMQGANTAPSIIAALENIEQTIDLWDCVVIIRGGGSTSDLNGFDELNLARAVATFPLPVYVGIGHERDNTVLDEIACVRCKTPTAVAANLIENLHVCELRMEKFVETILSYSSGMLESQNSALAAIATKLPLLAVNAGERELKKLENLSARLRIAENEAFSNAKNNLHRYESRIGIAAARSLGRAESLLQIRAARIDPAANKLLLKSTDRINALENMTRLLDPANILQRGYSITRINGRAIKNAGNVRPGDRIETTLHQGVIRATVDDTDSASRQLI